MKLYIFSKKLMGSLLAFSILVACQQTTKNSTEITVSGSIDQNTVWKSNTTYILDQQVTVNSGATLTIEAGTVVKALPGEAPSVSMLVIARGGKINAKGTAEHPIIFTSINDNIDAKAGVVSALDSSDVGLWGGIIILGNAPVSLANGEEDTFYLGLDPNSPSSYYGGQNAQDDSGSLEYVSIRHGGIFIGTGSESNGLTLCGVGSKTKINNIEIFANQDDGIEFFGGNVNVSNLIVHGSGDDGIDIDEGYTGNITNFLVELENGADSAIEISGGQGQFSGEFNLSNGTLDGNNLEDITLYSIDKYAKGTISGLMETNIGNSTRKKNASSNVSVKMTEQSSLNDSTFSWTKTKS
ncbi:MAG: hypothetical protein ACPIB2_05545 [Flavobacteriaceae bacterium]